MKKTLLSLLCCIFILTPAHAGILVIGQQKDVIDHYIKQIGMPDGFMVYTSIQELSGLYAPADHGAGIQHGQYYVSKYPNAVIQLAVYLKGALDEIIAGRYDGNIVKLGRWIKKAKRPVYLRLGYEFDLPDNQYGSDAYVKAYRYIVVRLQDMGVKNAHYVWHSAAMRNGAGNPMNWYPGDNFVDAVGVSFFGDQQLVTIEMFYNIAKAHGKKFMIAEATPAGLYTPKAKRSWYEKFFHFIKTHDVEVVSYINSNWDILPMFDHMDWGDARVENNPEVKALWLEFLKQSF